MGHLGDDARAVAGIALRAGGAAMLEVDQELDALGHDIMGLLALDMDDESHAAGVMLVRAIVQAFVLGYSWSLHVFFLLKKSIRRNDHPPLPFAGEVAGKPARKNLTCVST